MSRFLKFILIAAPFVVVYFFSLLFVVLGLSDAEAVSLEIPLLALLSAVISVLIVTWASGFWGRWWFPVSFALVPLMIFSDFIVSSALGIRPMLIALSCIVTLSVYGSVKCVIHNKVVNKDAPDNA